MRHYAMATEENFSEAAGMDGGHIGGHISGNQEDSRSPQVVGLKAKNPGETEVLSASDDSGELAESAISGRNRSRICDLLHVKQAL